MWLRLLLSLYHLVVALLACLSVLVCYLSHNLRQFDAGGCLNKLISKHLVCGRYHCDSAF